MTDWLLGSLVVLIGASVQGITGFGFALICVPALMLILPQQYVVPTMIVMGFFSNLIIVLESRRGIDRALLFPLIAGGLIGLTPGIFLLTNVPAPALKLLVGVVVCCFALLLLAGWSRPVAQRPRNLVPVGMLSGLLHGSIAIPGPPVILFLTNQGVAKAVFRGTITSYFLSINIGAVLWMLYSGLIDREVLALAGGFVPVEFIGLFLGIRLSRVISEGMFRRITLVLAIVTGSILLATTLRDTLAG